MRDESQMWEGMIINLFFMGPKLLVIVQPIRNDHHSSLPQMELRHAMGIRLFEKKWLRKNSENCTGDGIASVTVAITRIGTEKRVMVKVN